MSFVFKCNPNKDVSILLKKREKNHASGLLNRQIEIVNKCIDKNKYFIKKYIMQGNQDFSYICENQNLLKKHIKFINSLEYDIYSNSTISSKKLILPSQIKYFCGFREFYKHIYDRWKHMIYSCYSINYSFYKHFGARSITVSDEFLDTKQFCIWCLKNGLCNRPHMYTTYLQRKDKSKGYSPDNCFAIKESDIHTNANMKIALNNLYLAKRYNEDHDKTVTYLSMYTRYYMYDFDLDLALHYKLDRTNAFTNKFTIGFFPTRFYQSVAKESDVPLKIFINRLSKSSVDKNFNLKPYELLKPDYSFTKDATSQGITTYMTLWYKRKSHEKAISLRKNNTPNKDNNDL